MFGTTYNAKERSYYINSYIKKGVGLGGNDSAGQIFKVNMTSGSPVISTYVDLNAVFPGSTGANPHPAGSTPDWQRDPAISSIGKIGLGGNAITADGKYLLVVNLFDRQVYRIPLLATPTNTNIVAYPIPTTGLNTLDSSLASIPCPSADVRPFAVATDAYSGKSYIGAVCSGETNSTGINPAINPASNNLRLYMWEFDPTSGTFTLVMDQGPMTWDRDGFGFTYNTTDDAAFLSNDWEPWMTPNHAIDGPSNTANYQNQPMFTGLTFDRNGPVISLRDRGGDQQVFG